MIALDAWTMLRYLFVAAAWHMLGIVHRPNFGLGALFES